MEWCITDLRADVNEGAAVVVRAGTPCAVTGAMMDASWTGRGVSFPTFPG